MRPILRLTPWALALPLALIIGCGRSGAPVAPTNGAGQATATQLSAAALGSDMQVAESALMGGCNSVGFPLWIPRGIPGGCPYDAATGWFTCTMNGPSGLTRTLTYQFRDASGTPQSAFDDTLTAEVQVKSSVVGTVRTRRHTRTFDDHRDLTVSGLAGKETSRTWNGTGSTSHTDSSKAGLRTAQSNTTVEDVVIPTPFVRDSWPLSGSITTHVVKSSGVDLTAVLTFNGTRYATLTVNGTTTTVDLARWLHGGRGLDDDDDREGNDDGDQGDDGNGDQDGDGEDLRPVPVADRR